MHQTSITGALPARNVAAILNQAERDENGKLSARDAAVFAAEVAGALGFCMLVNLGMG